MSTARERYAGMKSILEAPILNEKYWSKVPTAAADAIMMDLEDSATPDNKVAVRQKVIAALAEPAYFGGRHQIVRVNNLATPWGRDDLEALCATDADFLVCYPKVESREETQEVLDIMARGKRPRGLYVMIETARAMIELDRIAATPGVVGLHFGYVDYSADIGSTAFSEAGDDLYAPANYYARTKIAVAAAAYRLFATGGSMIPEYKDLAKVEAFIRVWARLGYTACIGLAPSHLEIINRVMSPTAEEADRARTICAAYEEAMRKGDPAVVIGGKVVTNPDYRVARLTLMRSGEPVTA